MESVESAYEQAVPYVGVAVAWMVEIVTLPLGLMQNYTTEEYHSHFENFRETIRQESIKNYKCKTN
jgi:hypothetical protein